MPNYKLIYFDGKGRVEPDRYMFELAGVKYEDKRYGFTDEEWLNDVKPKLLFGQLPVLEVDGKELYQSFAIHYYLAETLGFMPEDLMDKTHVIMVNEGLRDMDPTVEQWFYEKDEAKKTELLEKLKTDLLPKMIGRMEKLLQRNKDGQGWFVGDKLSLADIVVFSTLYDGLPAIVGKKEGEWPMDEYPLLKAHMDRFHALPQIRKWIEKRPSTPF